MAIIPHSWKVNHETYNFDAYSDHTVTYSEDSTTWDVTWLLGRRGLLTRSCDHCASHDWSIRCELRSTYVTTIQPRTINNMWMTSLSLTPQNMSVPCRISILLSIEIQVWAFGSLHLQPTFISDHPPTSTANVLFIFSIIWAAPFTKNDQ